MKCLQLQECQQQHQRQQQNERHIKRRNASNVSDTTAYSIETPTTILATGRMLPTIGAPPRAGTLAKIGKPAPTLREANYIRHVSSRVQVQSISRDDSGNGDARNSREFINKQ